MTYHSMFFYSFLSHCHTKLGALDLTDWRFLSVNCGHCITSSHQLPNVCRSLQERRKHAIQFVLFTQLTDYHNSRICIHHRRVHQHYRHIETHEVISPVAFVLVLKQQHKNYRWSRWVVNVLILFINDQPLLLLR